MAKLGKSSWGSIMLGRIAQIVSFLIVVVGVVVWSTVPRLVAILIIVGWFVKELGTVVETDSKTGRIKKNNFNLKYISKSH